MTGAMTSRFMTGSPQAIPQGILSEEESRQIQIGMQKMLQDPEVRAIVYVLRERFGRCCVC